MNKQANVSSVIPSELIQAYLETEYRILGEQPFTIKVGELSRDLLSTHKQNRVSSSAFLTAWNPYSQKADDATNRELQSTLAKNLLHRSLNFIEGIGQHPSNKWAGEESYLVLGLTLEAAKTLGRRLEQNAIVWSGASAVPQLILLR
ncbi:MAG: DUF3293 domain-containing protein [Rhodocyclaceae bacterium]|jgi:hypothetical protein|nr:DUF3293 domain-containing protein [Rhodocyclaceae bacterium]